jgi:hypothetical protein
MERLCLSCGEPLIGRADKKFCNDSCRNNHYHSQHKGNINFVRNINNQLKRNRGILEQLNPDGKTTVRKSQLDKLGFNFKYFTNTYTTKDGRVYHFVYEQGYLPLEKDFFMLVTNTDI